MSLKCFVDANWREEMSIYRLFLVSSCWWFQDGGKTNFSRRRLAAMNITRESLGMRLALHHTAHLPPTCYQPNSEHDICSSLLLLSNHSPRPLSHITPSSKLGMKRRHIHLRLLVDIHLIVELHPLLLVIVHMILPVSSTMCTSLSLVLFGAQWRGWNRPRTCARKRSSGIAIELRGLEGSPILLPPDGPVEPVQEVKLVLST